MNAWFLSALLCTPASAAVVVEAVAPAGPVAPVSAAVGAAVMPVSAVPGVSVFAPSLGAAAAFSAFPGQAPAAVYLAPPAAAPAVQAAPSATVVPVRADPATPVPARGRRETLPPADATGARPLTAVAPAPSSQGGSAAVGALSARLDAAGAQPAIPVGADGASRAAAESAALDGARLFDNSTRRALLDDSGDGKARPESGGDTVASGSFARQDAGGTQARLRAATAGRADGGAPSSLAAGEDLRDAVGSPAAPAAGFFARAAAAPGAAGRVALRALVGAPSAAAVLRAGPVRAPSSFDRLSLESGAGLVVRIGAAAESPFKSVAPKPFSAGTLPSSSGAGSALAHGAPVTSTEWLERRGLLETLSVTEAAADQSARAALAAPATVAPPSVRRASAPLRRDEPSPLPEPLWWGLAFLPAAAVVLFKDIL